MQKNSRALAKCYYQAIQNLFVAVDEVPKRHVQTMGTLAAQVMAHSKRIQELEAGDANLKESMSRSILHASTPGIRFESLSKVAEESKSANPRRMGTGVRSCIHNEISSLNHPYNPPTGSIGFTNKQYLNILQSMGQALHIVYQDGLIVYWNRAAERILWVLYSASEALGISKAGYIKYLPPVPHYMMIVAPESFQETMVPDSLGTKPLKGNSYPSSSWLCIGGLTTTKPDFDPRHKPLKSITSWLIPKLISRSKNKVCPKMKTLETALSDHGVHPYLENICPRNPFRNSSDDKDASKTGVYKMITSRVKGISWSWDSQQVSRSLSYSTNSDVTSSMRSRSTSSSRSSPHRKFYMETDYLNYDISLSNLTFGEQIVQGSCATVYHGLWCGTDVAIKVFLKFDYSDLLMQHSFRQEVSDFCHL
ncbi:hypothetical protein C5167_024008 [Papaver somniferum]|uniref:PAS domain-containing protein n=1 Tax=Papaver somniferum TaxID=3469 RepID=A0A4Y7JMA9_PAPSO|nr:hypothetical protein C5167_024008 [Papaver somniferum]